MRPQRDDRREMIITGYQNVFANYCNLAGLATSTSCSLQNCSTEASHATFCKMLQDAWSIALHSSTSNNYKNERFVGARSNVLRRY